MNPYSVLCAGCRKLGCKSTRRDHDFGAIKDALGLTPCEKKGDFGRQCPCLQFKAVPLEVVRSVEEIAA